MPKGILRIWSTEEDELLRQRYPSEGYSESLIKIFGCAHTVVRRRVKFLGLVRATMGKKWSTEEDAFICKNYPAKGRSIVLVGRSTYDIEKRARQLRVKYHKKGKQTWDDNRISILFARYPSEGSSKHLQETLGRTRDQIRRKASDLGLRCNNGVLHKRLAEGQGKGKNNKRYQGYKCIHSSHFTAGRAGAKRRGLDYSVLTNTQENKEYLFSLITGICALSGRTLKFKTRVGDPDGNASLDRIDSSKGYVKGNVQWVHKDINTMKMNMTEEAFVAFCCDVARYRGGLVDPPVVS